MVKRRRTTARTPRRAKRTLAPRPAPVRLSSEPGSFGEWLHYLMPDADPAHAPMWPPDAFAVAAAFLRRTGGYVNLVNGCQAKSSVKLLSAENARTIGEAWRQSIERAVMDKQGEIKWNCPPAVHDAWALLLQSGDMMLAKCRENNDLMAAAINLCVISDSACSGMGIDFQNDKFTAVAESLADNNKRRSYCFEILPDKLAVLGKQHTPQRGCSIRSLTHNLALYAPTEIQAYWPAPIEAESAALDVFNILLLPWPAEVNDADFSSSAERDHERVPATLQSGAHRYFDYSPTAVETPAAVARRVALAMEKASSRVDRIHAVVLPELALSEAQFFEVEREVAERGAMLVSGVRLDPIGEHNDMPANACAIQAIGLTKRPAQKRWEDQQYDLMRRWQLKHHRWCLERRQVIQYRLGARIPASRDSWERSYIGPRDINFVTLTRWLTVCTLICEDLARQEPVTEVVRAVGPNLIFALLMDGPQLRNRWSSRYASVLAEDPGSSILSVTSLGMSRRSEPSTDNPGQPDKRHTVALWRDAHFGEREIAVADPEHDACVLSLVCKMDEEFTIDGRSDNRMAHFPVYAGDFSFAVNPAAGAKVVK